MKNWRLMIDNRIQHLEIFTLRLIYGITTKINNKMPKHKQEPPFLSHLKV